MIQRAKQICAESEGSIYLQIQYGLNSIFAVLKVLRKNFLAALSKFCYFFITVNTSIFIAWLKYLKGERATFWEPSKR